MGGDGRSEVPGLALLPPPGQIQDRWWGLGCLEGPRLLERARTCPRSDSGFQCESSSGGRTAGVAEGHRLQDQHRPSAGIAPAHPCPKSQGCLPTERLGSEWLEEPRKSQRRQLQNHGSPFIAQPSRAHPPPQSQGAGRQPQSSAQPSKQDHRAGGTGSRREPHYVPSSPLTGPAARARAGLSPREPRLGGRGNRGHVPCQRTVPSSAGHSCSSWNTPAFTQPSRRAYSRS